MNWCRISSVNSTIDSMMFTFFATVPVASTKSNTVLKHVGEEANKRPWKKQHFHIGVFLSRWPTRPIRPIRSFWCHGRENTRENHRKSRSDRVDSRLNGLIQRQITLPMRTQTSNDLKKISSKCKVLPSDNIKHHSSNPNISNWTNTFNKHLWTFSVFFVWIAVVCELTPFQKPWFGNVTQQRRWRADMGNLLQAVSPNKNWCFQPIWKICSSNWIISKK